MESWYDYMVAQAGAAAALAGLIFVGLSINLDRLLKFPAVLNRAAAAIAMLVSVLVIASLTLVPDDSIRSIGIQVLAIAGAVWGFVTYLSIKVVREVGHPYERKAGFLFLLRQGSLWPMLIGGWRLAMGHEGGLDWLVRAFTLIFVVTIVEAWVILVEVDR